MRIGLIQVGSVRRAVMPMGMSIKKRTERGNEYYEGMQNYGYEDSEGLENVQRSKRYLEELL
jgi:hypothetical protein